MFFIFLTTKHLLWIITLQKGLLDQMRALYFSTGLESIPRKVTRLT